jgi:hypothetical protein
MYFILDKLFYQGGKSGDENLLYVVEVVFDDVVISLESIPKRIKIMNEFFILRGAAVFIETKIAERTAIGHYVAVSLRNDGHWEEYDDFKHKPVPIPEQTKYGVQILLRNKEN